MPIFLNLEQRASSIALICGQIDPHWTVKLSIYGFMLLALWLLFSAYKAGRESLATYVMGFLFGYSIEAVNTFAGNYCYQYGPEWLYLPGDVPLYVSCGWAMIFYAAYYTSVKLSRDWLAVATLSGLLALALDLVLDPGTVALGLWEWLPPEELATVWPWYSVPWSNFVGWYLLIFSLAFAQYSLIDKRALNHESDSALPKLLFTKLKVMALAYLCFALLYFLYSIISRLFPGHVWQTVLHGCLLAISGIVIVMRSAFFKTGHALSLSLLAVPSYLLLCAILYLSLAVTNQVYQPLVFTLPLYSTGILMMYFWPYRNRKLSN